MAAKRRSTCGLAIAPYLVPAECMVRKTVCLSSNRFRFGSKAEILRRDSHVRSAPDSGPASGLIVRSPKSRAAPKPAYRTTIRTLAPSKLRTAPANVSLALRDAEMNDRNGAGYLLHDLDSRCILATIKSGASATSSLLCSRIKSILPPVAPTLRTRYCNNARVYDGRTYRRDMCSARAHVQHHRASRALFESEDPLPVVFHADDGPAFLFRLAIKRLSEGADFGGWQSLGWAVGVFTICVIVHDQHHQPRAIAGVGVLEHLPVAVRIAKGRARPTANHQMDALGLASLVVIQEKFRLLREERHAVLVIAELRAARGSDNLFGRYPVHLLAVDTNEILAAAGYNVRLETIGTQMLHDLEHRLVDEFGVGTLPARVLGAGQPLFHLALKVFHRHAGQRRHQDFLKLMQRQLCDGLAVAREDRFERLDVLEFRIFLDNGWNTIEAIDDLRIDRMLDPERAVLIESRDALFRRNEF